MRSTSLQEPSPGRDWPRGAGTPGGALTYVSEAGTAATHWWGQEKQVKRRSALLWPCHPKLTFDLCLLPLQISLQLELIRQNLEDKVHRSLVAERYLASNEMVHRTQVSPVPILEGWWFKSTSKQFRCEFICCRCVQPAWSSWKKSCRRPEGVRRASYRSDRLYTSTDTQNRYRTEMQGWSFV